MERKNFLKRMVQYNVTPHSISSKLPHGHDSTFILVPKYLLSATCSQSFLTALVISKINIISAMELINSIFKKYIWKNATY